MAQIAAPARPVPGFKNSASFGLSYGEQNDRDAWFWGWSLDYSRQVGSAWFAAVALAWDQETERFDDGPDADVKTYTLIATVSYGLTKSLAITTGLGLGIADTDNSSGSMRFTDGDLGTGVALAWSTPGLSHYERDSLSLSLAYEANLSQNETSLSFDVTYGWSF